MSFSEDSSGKKQNHGNKLDLAKIIADYQMQAKSRGSSQKRQPEEPYILKRNNTSELEKNELADSSEVASKIGNLELQRKYSHEHDVSKLKHPMPTKSKSQRPRQIIRKEATSKANAPHATVSSSTHETKTSLGGKDDTNAASLKHNGKSKADINNISKPKRPLSAYNIFFRDQRLKLLEQQKPPAKLNKDSTNHPVSTDSLNPSKKLNRGQAKNAPEEKAPKKIGFSQLAKTVSTQWKAIEPQLRAHYEAQAQLDLERYKKERDLYQEIKMEALSAARLQLEMTVDSDTKKRYLLAGKSKRQPKRKK